MVSESYLNAPYIKYRVTLIKGEKIMEILGPLIGVLATGIIVGWISMFFIRRLENYTIKGLSIVLSTLFGAVILQWISKGKTLWFCYPVGIIIGMYIYIKVALSLGADPDGIAFGRLLVKRPPKQE